MQCSEDSNSRGSIVAVGAIIIFSIVVIMAVFIQTNIVPNQRETAELEHNGQIENQFSKVNSDILSSSSNGEYGSTSLEMSPKYSSGMLMSIIPKMQPPSPPGDLDLNQFDQRVKIYNASGVGGASGYWPENDGSAVCNEPSHCYKNSYLSYKIDYYEVSDSQTPVRNISYGVVYEKYSDGPSDKYLFKNQQPLIQNNNINIVTLSGNISEHQKDSESLEVTPASAPAQPITIEPEDGPIKISLPTKIPENVWENQILDNQMVDSGGKIENLKKEDGHLNITMVRGVSYSLKLSKIHLSTDAFKGANKEPAQYVSWAGNNQISIKEDELNILNGQVRDKYNNPVVGVGVVSEARDSNGNCIGDFQSGTGTCTRNGKTYSQPGKKLSGDNGEVTFFYEAPEVADNVDISVSMKLE